MNKLELFLKKLGVNSYEDLNSEEKETYRQWELSLRGRKLTDDDVANFLATEENMTVTSLISKKLSEREDIFLKMKLDFIRKVRGFLSSPQVEKNMVESNIEARL